MTRRVRFLIALGLILGLLATVLLWRVTRKDESVFPSPLGTPPSSPLPAASSPLVKPTTTSPDSPLPVPPTAPPLITTATLEAIRATRPTATPPTPSGIRLPYISPATWRGWALRTLIVAVLLAYIGLRLRRGQ